MEPCGFDQAIARLASETSLYVHLCIYNDWLIVSNKQLNLLNITSARGHTILLDTSLRQIHKHCQNTFTIDNRGTFEMLIGSRKFNSGEILKDDLCNVVKALKSQLSFGGRP